MILPLVMHRPTNPYLVESLGYVSSGAYHDARNMGRVPVPDLPQYPGNVITSGFTFGGWLPDDIQFRYEFSKTSSIGSGANIFSTTYTVECMVDDVFVPRPDDVLSYPKQGFCEDTPLEWIALGTMRITRVDTSGNAWPPSNRRVALRARPAETPTIDLSEAVPQDVALGDLIWGGTGIWNLKRLEWRQNQWQPVWASGSPVVQPAISSRVPLRV